MRPNGSLYSACLPGQMISAQATCGAQAGPLAAAKLCSL